MLSFFSIFALSKVHTPRRPLIAPIDNLARNDNGELCPVPYTIQQGDTLAKLSSKYGLSELYFLNPKKNIQQLNYQDTIYVPSDDCDRETKYKLYYPSDNEFSDFQGYTIVFCVAYILGEQYRTVSSIKSLANQLISLLAIQKNGIVSPKYIANQNYFHFSVLNMYQESKNRNTFIINYDNDLEYFVKDGNHNIVYNPTKHAKPISYGMDYIFSPST